MSSMKTVGALALFIGAGANAAVFSTYNPGDLGPDLLIDEAVTGGADLVVDGGNAIFAGFEVANLWNAGDAVSITGIALPLWANSSNATNNTVNGTFTFTFYGLGGGPNADKYDGEANEQLLGSATVDFTSQNTGVFVFDAIFDQAIDFTADSSGFVFRIQSTGSFRLKRGAGTGAQQIRIDNGNYAGGGGQFGSFTFSGTAIPAPGAAGLLGLAMVGAGRRRR
jgi:MYXO-CTERM domain-containing protein